MLDESAGLYVQETYLIEVPDSRTLRHKAVEFTAEPPAKRREGEAHAPPLQLVRIPVERQTNDITLSVVVEVKSSALASSAKLAAPSGLPYTIAYDPGEKREL